MCAIKSQYFVWPHVRFEPRSYLNELITDFSHMKAQNRRLAVLRLCHAAFDVKGELCSSVTSAYVKSFNCIFPFPILKVIWVTNVFFFPYRTVMGIIMTLPASDCSWYGTADAFWADFISCCQLQSLCLAKMAQFRRRCRVAGSGRVCLCTQACAKRACWQVWYRVHLPPEPSHTQQTIECEIVMGAGPLGAGRGAGRAAAPVSWLGWCQGLSLRATPSLSLSLHSDAHTHTQHY